MKAMAARFNGKCRGCGGRIEAGEQILWSKATGALHGECGLNEDFGGAEARLAQREERGHTLYQEYAGAAFQRAYDDEFDAEAELIRREEAEYQKGYHEVKNIQAFAPAGSLLREAMYLEMEMAAYNRGEDY